MKKLNWAIWLWGFLFVASVGAVGEVQYSRGFEAGGTKARIEERAEMARVMSLIPADCYPDMPELP